MRHGDELRVDHIGRSADKLADEHLAADDAGRGAGNGDQGRAQLTIRHV